MTSYKDYPLSADTSPEAEKLLFKLLRQKSPAEKLKMVSLMNATVRSLTMSGLRERYSRENEIELKFRLAELLYGTEAAESIAERLKNFSNNE